MSQLSGSDRMVRNLMSETSSLSRCRTALLYAVLLLLFQPWSALAAEGARIDLLALPLPTVAGVAEVVVVAEVAGADLLAEAEANALDGALTLRLVEASGEQVAEFEQPFALTLNGRIEAFRSTGLRYFASFPDVAPGVYRLEAVVRAQGGSISGTSTTELNVAAEGQLFFWPPLVAASSRGWLSYAQSVGPGAERTGAYPFVRGDGTQFVPSVRAVVPEGSPALIEIFGFGETMFEDVKLEIGPSEGVASIEGTELEFVTVAQPTALKGQHRQAALQLGSASVGDRIRLSLVTQGGMAPLALEVELGDRAQHASQTSEASADLAESTLEPVEVDPNVKKAVEQVLDVLAQGTVTDAVQMVLGMSTDFLGKAGVSPKKRRSMTTQVRKQRAAWMAAGRDIVKVEPLALLPVVLLHKRVTDHYAQMGNMWVGAQSVMTERNIADLYIEHLSSASRAAEGADLRAVLGDYHGALDLDPDHQFSLLKIALSSEQRGDWRVATTTLQHLSRLRPKDDEVWLRLALNLDRSERVAEARGMLLSILDRERVEYRVAILAFQELARLETGQGNPRRAAKILERGLTLYPENQRLRLELGLIYEKMGRRRDAERQLNRIRAALPPTVETPRSWYARGPEDEIREANRRFVETSTGHLPHLAKLRKSAGGSP